MYTKLNMSDDLASDACGIDQYVHSFEHNQKIINELRIDELTHVENELNLYEKVHQSQ